MLQGSDVPKKAWAVIASQSLIILFLSSWLVEEYLNNPFMGQYLSQLAPTIFPILSVFFGVVAAMTATTFYVRVRRARAENDRIETQKQARRTTTAGTAPRKRAGSTVARQPQSIGSLPMPKIIVTTETSTPAPVISSSPPTNEKKQEENSSGPSPSNPQAQQETPVVTPAPQTVQETVPSPSSPSHPSSTPAPVQSRQSQGEAKQ